MEFEFQANWSRMSEPPPSGKRYLVTDGHIIVIGTYIQDAMGCTWIFSGLTGDDVDNFDVQGWMPQPKPIKKIVNETITEKPNKGN